MEKYRNVHMCLFCQYHLLMLLEISCMNHNQLHIIKQATFDVSAYQKFALCLFVLHNKVCYPRIKASCMLDFFIHDSFTIMFLVTLVVSYLYIYALAIQFTTRIPFRYKTEQRSSEGMRRPLCSDRNGFESERLLLFCCCFYGLHAYT